MKRIRSLVLCVTRSKCENRSKRVTIIPSKQWQQWRHLLHRRYVYRMNESSLCCAAANIKYSAGNFYGVPRVFLADNTDQFNRLRCAISRLCVWCVRSSNENGIKIPNGIYVSFVFIIILYGWLVASAAGCVLFDISHFAFIHETTHHTNGPVWHQRRAKWRTEIDITIQIRTYIVCCLAWLEISWSSPIVW